MSNTTTLIEYLTTETSGILMLILIVLVASWIVFFLLCQAWRACTAKKTLRTGRTLHYKLLYSLPI